MTFKRNHWMMPAKKLLTTISCAALFTLASQPVFAQVSDKVRMEYPKLAELFNAFDITQAQTFEVISEINAHPDYAENRAVLREQMDKFKKMSISEILNYGMMNPEQMNMSIWSSPFTEIEIESRIKLLAVMRAEHSDKDTAEAYADNAVINRHLSMILRRGRDFENSLFDIFIDDSITDKATAVEAAIADYLSDDRHSVSPYPNESKYLVNHDQASGFLTAFPRISGLMWTQQWLQLAALEAVILKTIDKQFPNGVETALERFWNKIGTDGGMSMFPAPTELPMAPAIAPDLYSLSADAAIILDNLNILETVVTDILAYPNVMERDAKIETAIALFTRKDANTSQPLDYLLFALRGGIYNQGGPAVGDLTRSERNRSRDTMNMVHAAKRDTGL